MSQYKPFTADKPSDANLIALCTTMCPVQVMLQCRESARNSSDLTGDGIHDQALSSACKTDPWLV
jgi:hypothetical protein